MKSAININNNGTSYIVILLFLIQIPIRAVDNLKVGWLMRLKYAKTNHVKCNYKI